VDFQDQGFIVQISYATIPWIQTLQVPAVGQCYAVQFAKLLFTNSVRFDEVRAPNTATSAQFTVGT